MRLTLFSKLFIAAVACAVLGFIAWSRVSPRGLSTAPEIASTPRDSGLVETAPVAVPKNPKHWVVGVNDFGGAYPGLAANDGAIAGARSLFKKAGLDVEIKLIRGSKERLAAFDSGEVDIMLLTLDYFANLVPVYRAKGVELRSFLMVDWSRGNLGIVTKPSFTTTESLKTAKIATTRSTPTHYFLGSLLKKSNLSAADVETVKSNIVFATKTPLAGDLFKRGEVDAVAIWEPHLSQALEAGHGRLLVSTATATNLVADVLYAREDFLKAHEAEMGPFVQAWLDGVEKLTKEPDASVAIIAKAFSQTEAETRTVLSKIKPTTFADNREFFGLEKERCAYVTLFDDASRFWQKEAVIIAPAPAAPTRWLKALEQVGTKYSAQTVAEAYRFEHAPAADATAVLTKSISIYFASGDAALGPNARQIVDQFADTLEQFGNTYIRVEGNTDSVGARNGNLALSKKRAEAVTKYLVEHRGLDKTRMIAVGNGPDKPVGDNTLEEGRELNRRTDFALIANTQ